MKIDNRYSIQLEYCGKAKQQHVVRWCGDFLASYETLKEARAAIKDFFQPNWIKSGRQELRVIVGQTNDVTLYQSPHGFKIVYGADITETTSKQKAISVFKQCIQHSLECSL